MLVFVGHYLPGYKAGGIVRTIINTVDHLCEEFEFRVVTSDRDLADAEPYPGVVLGEWQKVGNALVYYVPASGHTLKAITALVQSVPGAVLYLNSFFDPFTVKVLFAVRTGAIRGRRVIVAPRGEFAWASLGQKYPKKLAFMLCARLFGLYRGVIWHASSRFEGDDIVKVMKVDPATIQVAFDFALKQQAPVEGMVAEGGGDDHGRLRMVFLSRVAREKNLDYALRILRDVRAEVLFEIYGPTADAAYWAECQAIMAELPPNVEVRYRGAAAADTVMEVFSHYDLFLFPTGGEAYGHVIVEALLAGTQLLVSRETPWRDLEPDGLGWDVGLEHPEQFVATIEQLSATPALERRARRSHVREAVAQRLADPAIAEAHRRLLLGAAR